MTLLKQLVPERIKRWMKHSAGVPSTEAALRHLKGLGFDPATVIDVGANVGEWTRMCKRLWPKASVLMIEPLPECEAPLARLASELPGVRYRRALLGAIDRASVSFHCCDTASSVLREYEAEHPSLDMPMTRLDDCSVGARGRAVHGGAQLRPLRHRRFLPPPAGPGLVVHGPGLRAPG